jgi:2'-5' RNA ligase
MGKPAAISHRVFFALQPDAPAAAEARRLAIELGLTPSPRPHVSLVGLGGDPGPPSRPWIDRVSAAASRVRAPAFLIELNTLSTFGAGAVVLRGEDGVIGIHLLCEVICAALAGEGLGGKPAAEPHLTIAWSRRLVPERRVAPVRWTARQLVLIDSHQGAGRHEVLATWPLRPTPSGARREESPDTVASDRGIGGN